MRKIVQSEKVIWIDVSNPTDEDVKFLEENFFFHPFILKSIIPPIRHPRFENYGDYLFLVLHYPFFERINRETKPRELDILVTRNTLITIHYHTVLPLRALFTRLSLYENEKEEFTDGGVGEVLYRLLNEILRASLPKLDRIDEKIDNIEKEVFKNKQRQVIQEISILKHDLIDFQRIIQPQATVFEGLKQASEKFFGEHYYPYFNELFNCFSTIKEVLQTHHQTLNELEETNSNLLSTRTNEVIKILTIFTVVLTPLALIANIFGMNTTYLPFVGDASDFWIIIGLMVLSFVLMVGYIKKKKWL
jgi:magnesium transporter